MGSGRNGRRPQGLFVWPAVGLDQVGRKEYMLGGNELSVVVGCVGGGRSAFRTAHNAYCPAQIFCKTFDLQTVPPTQANLQERG
jgi:hypothetical protein